MIIRNLPDGYTTEMLENAFNRVSYGRYAGNLTLDCTMGGTRKRHINFRIGVVSSREPGARRSASGRRMAHACWHAHRDVIAAIFASIPAAEVHSAIARYVGQTGFLKDFPDTRYQNIGSLFAPFYLGDACDCED